MLAVTKYEKEYVEGTRSRIDTQVSTYLDLAPTGEEALDIAFFNNLVLALDRYFLHRARGQEGKDGNPINEVRVICDSLVDHAGLMTANKTIKMKAADSLLGYEEGDEIKLNAEQFRRLSEGFFAEIERKFS